MSAYPMYDIRADLDFLIAKRDSVIQAAKSRDYNALTSALTDFRQATEKTFTGLKRFDDAVYNTISGHHAKGDLPFLTRANICQGIRQHIICLWETMILSYAEVTSLQGKAEDLSFKRQDGKLTSRCNLPKVKETYWEVNGIRVTQARKGQTVNVKHDMVEGTVTLNVKKDLRFLPDQEYAKRT